MWFLLPKVLPLVQVCVFWFLWYRLRLFVCLFGVGPTPLPRLVWVGFILSAPPWPPSPPPRTPNVCWPFPFQIPTINSCVCVEGRGEKIPRKRFLFGETEKGRERERERVGRSRLVMSCHVMSCHGKEGLLPFDQIADHDAPESSSSSSSFLGGRSAGRAALDQRRQANTRPWFEVEGGGLVLGRREGRGEGEAAWVFFGGVGASIKRKRPQERKKKLWVQGLFFEKMSCCSPSRS